jgi:hypothetical protein
MACRAQMYFNGQHDKFGRPVIYMKPVRDTSVDRVVKVAPSWLVITFFSAFILCIVHILMD